MAPFRPLCGLQQIPVTAPEENGGLCFHSRTGMTPWVSLECNLEICVAPGEEHWLLDTSLDEVYLPCSHSRAIPIFPSQLEWKIGNNGKIAAKVDRQHKKKPPVSEVVRLIPRGQCRQYPLPISSGRRVGSADSHFPPGGGSAALPFFSNHTPLFAASFYFTSPQC